MVVVPDGSVSHGSAEPSRAEHTLTCRFGRGHMQRPDGLALLQTCCHILGSPLSLSLSLSLSMISNKNVCVYIYIYMYIPVHVHVMYVYLRCVLLTLDAQSACNLYTSYNLANSTPGAHRGMA